MLARELLCDGRDDPAPGKQYDHSGEVALSYQVALANQLDITANNIANVSTPGFQSSHPIFAEFLVSIDETGQELPTLSTRAR